MASSAGRTVLWTVFSIAGLSIICTLIYLHKYDDSYRIGKLVNTHGSTDDPEVGTRRRESSSNNGMHKQEDAVPNEKSLISPNVTKRTSVEDEHMSKTDNKTLQPLATKAEVNKENAKPKETVKAEKESAKEAKDKPEQTVNKEKEKPKEKPYEGPISGEEDFRHEDIYKEYMQCPTTLRKRLQESKVFKDRYIPDIPVLMWDEHVTPEEYERLDNFWGCYGWEYLSYEGVKNTLQYLNTPGHRNMFDAGLHLNNTKNNGCIRCAVVGGGGILNGSRKGKEIDDHDYVFRVNVAPTGVYTEDVGSKTTHYAFTMTTLRNSLVAGGRFGFKSAPHDENIRYLVLPCEKADYILVENRGAGKPDSDFKDRDPKHRGLPRFGKTVTSHDLKMTHPDFQRYMEFYWIQSKRKYKRINRPSTGALMLIAAIHTCDEVDAYGFGVNFERYATHYYDKKYTKFIYYANHDFKQELKLWNDLDKEGIINLYTRDKKR